MFRNSSFPEEPGLPSAREQIATAEIIVGLPFVAVETVIAIKTRKGRDKDLVDIDLLRAWTEQQSLAKLKREEPSDD